MYLYILITTALVTLAYAICSPCPRPPRIYTELGCTAVPTTGRACTESYLCPDFTSFSKNQCYYQGNFYNIGEVLPKAISPNCYGTCTCQRNSFPGSSGYAQFVCQRMLCPANRIGPSCVRQNFLKECCGLAPAVCGDKVKELPTCILRGQTYIGGNFMYPNDTCYQCVCDANFNNATALSRNKNCQRESCNTEIDHYINLVDGCVPIYDVGPNACCPIGFRCPSKNDYIVPSPKNIVGPTCKFGKLTLKREDSLNIVSKHKCLSCICRPPPMVQCSVIPGCVPSSSAANSPSTSSIYY